MTGRKILIAGLVLQVASFGIFIFIAAAFDIKSRRSLGADAMSRFRPLFTAFYVSAALITARSIFRTIGKRICAPSWDAANAELSGSPCRIRVYQLHIWREPRLHLHSRVAVLRLRFYPDHGTSFPFGA